MFVYVCKLDGADASARIKAGSELDAAETFVGRLHQRHGGQTGSPAGDHELDFDLGVTVRVRAAAAPRRLERRFRVRVVLVPQPVGEEV